MGAKVKVPRGKSYAFKQGVFLEVAVGDASLLALTVLVLNEINQLAKYIPLSSTFF